MKDAQNRVKKGLFVQKILPGSPAARAGINQGDVIFKISGKRVYDVSSYYKLVRTFKLGELIPIIAYRGTADLVFILLILPKE